MPALDGAFAFRLRAELSLRRRLVAAAPRKLELEFKLDFGRARLRGRRRRPSGGSPDREQQGSLVRLRRERLIDREAVQAASTTARRGVGAAFILVHRVP